MRRGVAAAIAIVVAVGIVLIYKHFDPTFSHFAPKCPFHLLTGYDCPSCGIQRAMYAALNGDLKRAFWLNPFVALVMPYFLLIVLTTFAKGKHIENLRSIVQHRYAVYGYIALFFIWWVVRNTTWWQGVLSQYL